MSYTAKDVDEVSLPSGVKVEVLEKSFTGWWKVKSVIVILNCTY